jgi:hypothetical protein
MVNNVSQEDWADVQLTSEALANARNKLAESLREISLDDDKG